MKKKEIWHVIYTKSRHEKILAEQLKQSGYEIYLPLVKKITSWSDRKKTIEEPLFKSYIFIKNQNDRNRFKEFKSFVGFVQYDNKPAIVWQHEIDTLISIIKHGYDINEIISENDFKVGSKVMVMYGPLKGMIGDMISNENNEGFNIGFENFGNSLIVKLPSKILKKIE
jgi:transcription antitermination factor NusG